MAYLVQAFVASNRWGNKDDDGEIRALEGALVVKQTADVQRSIQRFLAQFEPKSPSDQAELENSPAAAATQTLPDPFGVLQPAGRTAAGMRNDSAADRPKSPMKKYKRTDRSSLMAMPASS